jgi:hypothetical protein
MNQEKLAKLDPRISKTNYLKSHVSKNDIKNQPKMSNPLDSPSKPQKPSIINSNVPKKSKTKPSSLKTIPSRYKPQFKILIPAILSHEDTRSSLMIKNIPNKYTKNMVIKELDVQFSSKYDFFYLPIDFNHECNVGYAFINFRSYLTIPEFFNAFHGKKWPKFKSTKICELSYARVQGKEALVKHFQKSKVSMKEEKRYKAVAKDFEQ